MKLGRVVPCAPLLVSALVAAGCTVEPEENASSSQSNLDVRGASVIDQQCVAEAGDEGGLAEYGQVPGRCLRFALPIRERSLLDELLNATGSGDTAGLGGGDNARFSRRVRQPSLAVLCRVPPALSQPVPGVVLLTPQNEGVCVTNDGGQAFELQDWVTREVRVSDDESRESGDPPEALRRSSARQRQAEGCVEVEGHDRVRPRDLASCFAQLTQNSASVRDVVRLSQNFASLGLDGVRCTAMPSDDGVRFECESARESIAFSRKMSLVLRKSQSDPRALAVESTLYGRPERSCQELAETRASSRRRQVRAIARKILEQVARLCGTSGDVR